MKQNLQKYSLLDSPISKRKRKYSSPMQTPYEDISVMLSQVNSFYQPKTKAVSIQRKNQQRQQISPRNGMQEIRYRLATLSQDHFELREQLQLLFANFSFIIELVFTNINNKIEDYMDEKMQIQNERQRILEKQLKQKQRIYNEKLLELSKIIKLLEKQNASIRKQFQKILKINYQHQKQINKQMHVYQTTEKINFIPKITHSQSSKLQIRELSSNQKFQSINNIKQAISKIKDKLNSRNENKFVT